MRPTTTSATPATSAWPGGRCAPPAPTRGTPSTAPRSARSPAGSASTGTSPTPPPGDESLRPRGWAGMHWSPAIGAEHRAARERAGLFDESSFAKLEVAGPGAAEFLERLCDNDVARDVGAITYTQMLNRRGGIECDFTVTRVEEELFSIVTGTAFGNHDLSWIRRHAPHDGSVRCTDVTARWACFALWGPRARDILAPLTDDPLDFPYMHMRELAVGDVPVRALRVTFVGELGWELYCPTEYGAGLWRSAVAGRARARPDRRRLPRDRLAAPGEGLPRVGCRHHPRRDALRGRARLLRAQAGRLHRRARAGRRRRGESSAGAAATDERLRCIVLEDPRSVALGNEPVRVGRGDRRARHQRRLRLHRRALDRLRVRARRGRARRRGSRSTSSASGSRAPSRASRCSTRRASASGVSSAAARALLPGMPSRAG